MVGEERENVQIYILKNEVGHPPIVLTRGSVVSSGAKGIDNIIITVEYDNLPCFILIMFISSALSYSSNHYYYYYYY